MNAEIAAAGYQVSPIEAGVGELFSAAINDLALRSRFIKLFGGVDPGSDEGWESLIDAVEVVFRALRRES